MRAVRTRPNVWQYTQKHGFESVLIKIGSWSTYYCTNATNFPPPLSFNKFNQCQSFVTVSACSIKSIFLWIGRQTFHLNVFRWFSMFWGAAKTELVTWVTAWRIQQNIERLLYSCMFTSKTQENKSERQAVANHTSWHWQQTSEAQEL